MLLIGSVAVKYHVPDWREPQDIDIVGTYEEIERVQKLWDLKSTYPINGGKSIYMKTIYDEIIEAEIAWEGSRAEKLIKFVESQDDNEEICHDGLYYTIPSLDVLYLLKMSHRYLKDSPHFLKTMRDIQAMRKLGAKIRPEHEEFLKEREKDTYTYALPKLNQSKGDFFDNSTNIYTIDHDSIHEAVKIGEVPAYTYFVDGEVWCSKKLWDQCDEQIKLNAAFEEVMTLCIERAVHPYPHTDRRAAFDKAHMKLATSISSGWFREFVWENYDKVQTMYSEEYIERFYEALNSGKIRKFGE